MKRSILVLVICLFLVGLFATTYRMEYARADSGFDSGYDLGDSDWSDSDSDGSGVFFLIYLCFEHPILFLIIVAVIVISCITNAKKGKEIIDKALNDKLQLLNVKEFPENKQLEIEAFNIYKKIQYAWMNFDEKMIRDCTTDEMYNMYLMQMDTLKVKNQKNIMYDIKYLGSNIVRTEENNGQQTIVINMQVSCYDFIIDTNTKKVLRGNAAKVNTYSYELTFVKSTESKKLENCPRCGAPIKGNNSGVCEYCKSTIISNEYTLIMSKKKMLSQK